MALSLGSHLVKDFLGMRPHLFLPPRLDVFGDEAPVAAIQLKDGLHEKFMFRLGPWLTRATNQRIFVVAVGFARPPRHREMKIPEIWDFDLWRG